MTLGVSVSSGTLQFMSCTSLFVGRQKSVRRGSLCNERTRFVAISVTTESSQSRVGGLSVVFGPDQYVT